MSFFQVSLIPFNSFSQGHDTTSASVCWTLFLLGTSPEIQDKIVEELDSIFDGDRTRPPTMKELNDMKYLECAIKESLRLYPSVPFLGRHLHEDVQIGEYLVPAGTMALVSTYVLHRDKNVFPKPEIYNPDRFLPENSIGRHPYAYIPFSAGPRNCQLNFVYHFKTFFHLIFLYSQALDRSSHFWKRNQSSQLCYETTKSKQLIDVKT